jgi:hypothetical protein
MKLIQVLEHRTKLLSKYAVMDKTDPSPGIGNRVVLKAWTLRDDRTQSDLTLHCTDVQRTNGRSIENLQRGLGQIGNNLYAL